MKSTKKVWNNILFKNLFSKAVIIAVLAFGFVFAGCNPDDKPAADQFEGTWINKAGTGDTASILAGQYKIVVSGKNVTESAKLSGASTYTDITKGTYTASGDSRTITWTEVNPVMFGGDATGGFISYETFIANNSEYTTTNFPQTMTVTISGNSFTVSGMTFTKQ